MKGEYKGERGEWEGDAVGAGTVPASPPVPQSGPRGQPGADFLALLTALITFGPHPILIRPLSAKVCYFLFDSSLFCFFTHTPGADEESSALSVRSRRQVDFQCETVQSCSQSVLLVLPAKLGKVQLKPADTRSTRSSLRPWPTLSVS